MENIFDVIIIGSGPAGLTASIYTSRSGLKTLLLAGNKPGGQLTTTTKVENFPGFPDGILGPVLMQNMLKQAKKFGSKVKYSNVVDVDFSNKIKKVKSKEVEYRSKSVIISSGSSARKLEIEGENEFWSKGVHTCATCDGAFYKKKKVAVIGGGDSAMEESNFLSKFASKIYIIHRGDTLSASQIMQDKVKDNPKIEILWNSKVIKIKGNKSVEKLIIKNNKTNEKNELEIDGMFLAIGLIPNTKYLKDSVNLDDHGYIKTTNRTHTNVEGVFAAGDVKDYIYKQAIVSAGSGCKAAIDAKRWLDENA